MTKPRSFYFHFNKPETMRTGQVVVSIHYKDQCHMVNNLECFVPVKGRVRKTQPRFVMTGKAHSLEIVDGVGILR